MNNCNQKSGVQFIIVYYIITVSFPLMTFNYN